MVGPKLVSTSTAMASTAQTPAPPYHSSPIPTSPTTSPEIPMSLLYDAADINRTITGVSGKDGGDKLLSDPPATSELRLGLDVTADDERRVLRKLDLVSSPRGGRRWLTIDPYPAHDGGVYTPIH